MKKFLFLIMFSFIFFGCTLDKGIGGELISFSSEKNIEEIASRITPAIVGICGVKGDSESVGSGVCVGKDGYIVTNSHVINNTDDIILYLSNNKKASAKVIYEDTVLDFAVIKSSVAIPYLKLSEENVNVGEDILAVGTPLSLTLTHSFTKGIISAVNRTLKVSLSRGEGYMQNLIQHDASLNPGNSGGPLINLKGEIVGINTLKISGGEGIGFAIPVRSFKSLLTNYINDEDYELPYLGVYGIDSEIAEFQGLTNISKGFYVIDVASNSPLRKTGVSSAGVITKINGVKISNTLDLRNELYKHNNCDSVELEYITNGVCKNIVVSLKK